MNAKRDIRQIRVLIKTRRKEGETDSAIARELGVSKPQVPRLLVKYPGFKVARQLGIPEICPLCHKRKSERTRREIPRLGAEGWEKEYFKKPKVKK